MPLLDPKYKTRANFIGTAVLLSTFGFAPAAFSQDYTPDLLPQNTAPGQCYARVKHGAKFATGTETVTVQDGYQTLELGEDQTVEGRKSIMVKEPSVRFEVRQPTYKTVKDYVMTRPAYDKASVVPPQFETVTETLNTSAPRRYWKKGNPGALAAQGFNVLSTANGGYGSQTQSGYGSSGAYSSVSSSSSSGFSVANESNRCGPTCEIWCLVEEPATSVSYNRNVMTAPARIERIPVPAKFSHFSKQVVDDPGGVIEVPIPAQYRDIIVEEVIPAQPQIVDVAPKSAQIETKTLISEERYEWVRVICKTGQVIGPVGTPSYPEAAPGTYTPTQNTYSQDYSSSSAHQDVGYETGYQTYSGSHTGIVYGGQSSTSHASGQSYSNKQPSALIYGSSTSPAPHYGTGYDSPSAPRHYGGPGMNAHHSPDTP